jgi:hypothetical protein
MTRDTWRDHFESFAKRLAGSSLYVTVDLDCLRAEEASTNWENGLFTADDIAWALQTLRTHSPIVAGDLCGAYSPPKLARWTQRFASNWDHPKLPTIAKEESTRRNLEALKTIWPTLNPGPYLPVTNTIPTVINPIPSQALGASFSFKNTPAASTRIGGFKPSNGKM